ncbi:hypothetical protein ACYSNW_01435 [Enterococcus sp. LJL99]
MNQKQLEENKYWITKLTSEAMVSIPTNPDKEHSEKLGEIQSRIQSLQEEIHGVKEPTVKSTVINLHELSAATFNRLDSEEPITIEEIQELFYMEIMCLAELLGIELED